MSRLSVARDPAWPSLQSPKPSLTGGGIGAAFENAGTTRPSGPGSSGFHITIFEPS
jgi:hypothetical protein